MLLLEYIKTLDSLLDSANSLMDAGYEGRNVETEDINPIFKEDLADCNKKIRYLSIDFKKNFPEEFQIWEKFQEEMQDDSNLNVSDAYYYWICAITKSK